MNHQQYFNGLQISRPPRNETQRGYGDYSKVPFQTVGYRDFSPVTLPRPTWVDECRLDWDSITFATRGPLTWRIIPVSKYQVVTNPIYKPFRPLGRGPTTLFSGLTNHGYMVTYHLQVLG